MAHEKRQLWGNRLTFILAAIGSSVGLGNAWRFPGFAAAHGGGAFLCAYILFMIIMGMPLLMMEIAIGRKMRKGAPESMRGLNRRLEPIGWASVANAFVIAVYYAVVFAWVILMAVVSFKFAGITGDTDAAKNLWSTEIGATMNFSGFFTVKPLMLICLLAAWVAIYLCIKDGAQSVGKVVKYTVFIPEICLIIMAVKGVTMNGAMEGLKVLFIPDLQSFADPTLWVDAAAQVFYSISVMMAIMFAYGSFVRDDCNIATDACIIAGADFFTSILSAVVLFTTMYGTGMTTDNMSTSGIGTAFMIYPQAIVTLTGNGIINAIFGFIFYLCLITLAIDSAFSLIEGVSVSIADKFRRDKKKTTLAVCIVAAVLSLSMATGSGVAILDVIDHWCNDYNLIIVGIFEAIAVGWCFKTSKVLDEINRNTKKFRLPKWLFDASIKYISPLVLIVLIVWNIIALIRAGGIYGASDGYSFASNLIFGWLITALVLASGFIIRLIVFIKKKKGFVENDDSWEN